MGQINIPFLTLKKISDYDPCNISHVEEYYLLDSIYTTLFGTQSDGSINFLIAESFVWNDSDLHIKIKKNLKSSSGHKLNANDVAVSLKRSYIKSSNSHGSLKSVLHRCEIKTPFENCSSILSTSEHEIILKLKEQYFYIFNLLSSIDFAIIPINGLSKDGMKIIDYKNTSGAYEVQSYGDEILLQKNNSYININSINKSFFETVKIINIKTPNEAVAMFSQNKLQFIPTTYSLDDEDNSRKISTNSNQYISDDIQIRFLSFTKSGLKRTKLSDRISLRTQAQLAWKKYFKDKNIRFANNFLESNLKIDIPNNSNNQDTPYIKIKEKIVIGVFSAKYDLFYPALKDIENLEVRLLSNNQFFNLPIDIDAILISQDLGYDDNVLHVSYSMNRGVFGIFDEEAQSWLNKFMNEADKAKRISMIQDLNQNAYDNVSYIVLHKQPYRAFSQKGVKMDFIKKFALTPLYRLSPEK